MRKILDLVVFRPFGWLMMEAVVVLTGPIAILRIWTNEGLDWELKAMLLLAYLVLGRNAVLAWMWLYRDKKSQEEAACTTTDG